MSVQGICRQPFHFKRMATQLNNSAWLEWIGGLMGAGSRQTQTAMMPPDEFHCLLEELPLHLVPEWSQGEIFAQQFPGRPLFFNRECTLMQADQLPAELRERADLLKRFCRRGTIAWVRNRATSALNPFWLGSRLETIVSDLDRGKLGVDSIPRSARNLLAAAEILIDDYGNRGAPEWAATSNKSFTQFRDKGYAPLRGLIHPFHVAALRRYYRRAVRQGSVRLGDDQSSRRYVVHNDSVARFFHHQISPAVSATVGEPIKPSYVYLASYLPGAELKKHIDREQCEFSVTLCLDFSPEPKLATSWPIRVQTATGTAAVYQALGDGLLYRGTKVPHYRTALAEGFTSTSIFFHYVPADFSGALQ